MLPRRGQNGGDDGAHVREIDERQWPVQRVGLPEPAALHALPHVHVLHVVHGLQNRERQPRGQQVPLDRELGLVVEQRFQLRMGDRAAASMTFWPMVISRGSIGGPMDDRVAPLDRGR